MYVQDCVYWHFVQINYLGSAYFLQTLLINCGGLDIVNLNTLFFQCGGVYLMKLLPKEDT